jgi:hypothetical protein
VDEPRKTYRPTLRQGLEALGIVVVMWGIAWLFKDQVIGAVVTLVVLSLYLAHWFWRHRYS